MGGYFLLAIVIIGIFIGLVITRKDSTENNGLSKKGLTKLLILLALIFICVVVVVFLTPESWL
ncbi:DUF3976 domain-containing protein [Robertmurraya massiliosenegalensis]|uniref:DUF3976 domain-containing protein n=1 Tax=Robertmurraya massiliosenegalensis TaxID=1287657 RepID=UPI0002DCBAAE|nr:DUF3976 domain-containing protein [Robertmurraya massiliosenegalensis]